MKQEFLKKIFPTHETYKHRRKIMNFSQKDNETFFQCWERFKKLLLTCPYHGYETWRTITLFYEGLNFQMRQFVEMMCNGEFRNKDPEEAWDYFDHLAENGKSRNNNGRSDKSDRPKPNVMELRDVHLVKATEK